MKEVYEEYFINESGEVFKCNNGKLRKLKQSTQWGYKRVRLVIKGRETSRHVHRLLALAFIPNPENKPEVNHKDGDKSNNILDNLEWVTRAENNKHARELGLNKPLKGADNGRSILSEGQAVEILTLYLNSTKPYHEIAELFGVTTTTITALMLGKTWKHLPLPRRASKGRDDSELSYEIVVGMIKSGVSLKTIAEKLSVKVDRIYTINRKYLNAERLSKPHSLSGRE